jgi:hypothetical protein
MDLRPRLEEKREVVPETESAVSGTPDGATS